MDTLYIMQNGLELESGGSARLDKHRSSRIFRHFFLIRSVLHFFVMYFIQTHTEPTLIQTWEYLKYLL